MSAWPGKYVIGLTGNIATGKSVVRKMLEHLGAYGIDADVLGHRAIERGAPGFQPVIDAFGKWILNQDGQIDRTRLARVVFADADALKQLEQIVHPLVDEAINLLVRRSNHKFIVIEAIKLLESNLINACDTIWITYAAQDVQLERLINKRNVKESMALQRINSQPSQETKIAKADVVIRNENGFENTWNQVVNAWRAISYEPELDAQKPQSVSLEELSTHRATPGDAVEIAKFITQISTKGKIYTPSDIMAAFGEKAYFLLKRGDKIVGLIGYQVENLVSRLDELYFNHTIPIEQGIPILVDAVEESSKELQCEVTLLFLEPDLAVREKLWADLGYRESSIKGLEIRAWQEAAIESLPAGAVMRYKKMREDIILRPI
jgi:dephospho-CoA kinase